MENIEKEFQKALETLKVIVETSFKEYEKDRSKKNELVALWQQTINDFLQYAVKMSEEHNAKELYKSIARAMIFGR